jgi:hypothetical protein
LHLLAWYEVIQLLSCLFAQCTKKCLFTSVSILHLYKKEPIMKNAIVFAILLLSVGAAQAQSQPAPTTVGLRLYNNIRYASENVYLPGSLSTTKTLDFIQPSLAVFWGKGGGTLQEFEVSKFQVGARSTELATRNDTTGQVGTAYSGNRNKESRFRARYEALVPMFQSAEKQLQIRMGFGLVLDCGQLRSTPVETTSFPTQSTAVKIQAMVTPRLTYWFTERWGLDINVPLGLAGLEFIGGKNDNPALPVNSRTYTQMNFDMVISEVALRAGVAMKF